MKDLLTVREAAVMLGRTAPTVHYCISSGKLRAEKVGNAQLLTTTLAKAKHATLPKALAP